MRRETNSEIANLIRAARRWLRVLGIACIAAVVALTILYVVTMLRRPA